ncbi:MAG: heterocyst frequency control protein PatD [Xenococcaceae cyanobacterium]
MLSMPHSQAYQEFLTLVEKLNDDFFSVEDETELKSLPQQFQTVKAFFQQQIVGLASPQLDEEIATRWQSLQTELYREFRLLDTDILFLISSRQTKTRSQRLKSVHDRVERIVEYSKAIKSCLNR